MEHNIENEKQQTGLERLVLLIYTVYSLNLCYAGYLKEWENWIITLMIMGLATSWFVHVSRYKSFSVRALVTTVFLSLTIFFDGIKTDNFLTVLPTFFVITCLIALYGFTELVLLAGANMSILVIRQVIIMATSQNVDQQELLQVIFQTGNVAIFIVILTVWMINRVKAGEKVQQIIEDQIAAERAKDDFVANVSHEIRTPLNSIYGITDMLLSENDPEVMHREIHNIQMASRSLLSMVSDILDFSELSAGSSELEEEVYDVTSTVNDVINMTMAQIGNKDLELIVDLDVNMPKLLFGDEKKIRRVVMNLVSNAVKFTDSGCVILKIGGRRESYGLNLSISVTDTGIGMREENIEKLFTSYNQADTRRNRQGSGIGLGIAISRLLAQRLGGVITVRSKEGKGSTFTLVVPQKIVMETPIVVMEKNTAPSVAYYFNMEQFRMAEIRDAYTSMIGNLITGLGVSCQACLNLDDLKRRVDRKIYTHVFISYAEYYEDPEYFRKLAEQVKLAVVLDVNSDNKEITGNVIRIQKPFYALSAAAVFAAEHPGDVQMEAAHMAKFVAPAAKILVVDDNAMNIRVVQNLLKKYQIHVDTALSGMEALEKIGSMDYDFIFMDHMMPGMDGVETTHRIRQKLGSYFQKVPIVALTANAVAGSREMFLKEGMTDFLEKPVEPSVLERVLRRNIPADKLQEVKEEAAENRENTAAEVSSGSAEEVPVQKEASRQEDTGTSAAAEAEKKPQEKTENSGEALWSVLDRSSGLLYCGGEDGYIMILAENVRFYEEMSADLEKDFAEEDFTDYTIKIHALKSSMKSIGAMGLSEKSKALEFAGKAGEFQKIRDGHAEVMQEYHDLMERISREPGVRADLGEDFVFGGQKQQEVEVTADTERRLLSAEELSDMQMYFENAMYSLDEGSMKDIVSELGKCRIPGQDLEKIVQKMEHKISMGDYFSAGDLLASIKL